MDMVNKLFGKTQKTLNKKNKKYFIYLIFKHITIKWYSNNHKIAIAERISHSNF